MSDFLIDNNNSNYIKKISAFEQYKNKNINNDLIKFYYQFNHLKNIYRQGWIKNLLGKEYISQIESIADHSWSVAMLAISVIEKYKLKYDITKCMKLSIIHELGEIYAGDFTPSDNITKEKKHELEEKAIKKALDTIKFENDFFKELRLAANLGFLCWQVTTNSQNDAYMYGLKTVLDTKAFSASFAWQGYSGWIDDGDKPMVLKADITGNIGRFRPLLAYQYGLRDYPFHQFRIGLGYMF